VRSLLVTLFTLWLLLETVAAKDMAFAWDASQSTNVATYRLRWQTSFLITTKTFATVTNFPFQDAFAVHVLAVTTNGMESFPSYPVVVISAADKWVAIDFNGRPPLTFNYQAWLEGSNDLSKPFETLGLLGSFGIVADVPKRFYRVRLTPL